jgi:hypothetical protein
MPRAPERASIPRVGSNNSNTGRHSAVDQVGRTLGNRSGVLRIESSNRRLATTWQLPQATQRFEPVLRQNRWDPARVVGHNPKSQVARRAILDRRTEVVEAHRQPKAGGNLEVRGVQLFAADQAERIPNRPITTLQNRVG